MFEKFKNSICAYDMPISHISKNEKLKKTGQKEARLFAQDLTDTMYVFKQFFEVIPKVGDFGDVTYRPGEITKLTLDDSFCPGYTISFFMDNQKGHINGFSITISPS